MQHSEGVSWGGRARRGLGLGVTAVALLALSAPASFAVTWVIVRDENQSPVNGAEVWQNCQFQGTTNGAGQLVLNSAQSGDHLQVRTLVQAGAAPKGGHGGWAYHVWLTNIAMEDDGSQTDHTITDATQIQTVYVRRQQAQIGLNILASVEYNAGPSNLDDIALGLERASGYLFDVTDGQMFFEDVALYEDQQNWTDADLQYYATAWPSSNVDGIAAAADHLYLPGPGFDGNNYTPGTWQFPNGFRTIGHEMGHYGLALYDEYLTCNGGAGGSCGTDWNQRTDPWRSSIMNYQYASSELCHDANHSSNTQHQCVTKQSTWATMAARWASGSNQWSIRTPMTRGAVNPGPNALSCFSQVKPRVFPVNQPSCDPLFLKAHTSLNTAIANVGVWLQHGGYEVYEGVTDSLGRLSLFGAAPGDTVTLGAVYGGKGQLCRWDGLATVAACGPVDVVGDFNCMPILYEGPKIIVDWWNNIISVELQVGGQFDRHLDVWVGQNGINTRPLDLRPNRETGTLTGQYRFDAQLAPTFTVKVTMDGVAGAPRVTQRLQLEAAQYRAEGPAGAFLAEAWPLFASDGDLTLSVGGRSMADRTGVTSARVDEPAPAPDGLAFAAPARRIEGSGPLREPVTLTLRYDRAAVPEGADERITIHRLEGGRWVPLPTEVSRDAGRVSALADTWGTYAAFVEVGPAGR